MISNLIIQNYKSLRYVQLHKIPAFNVLVGANASGKSNFVDALDFLSHISRFGLSAAVQSKGGFENIAFRKTRRSKAPVLFSVTMPPSGESPRDQWHITYSFSIRATTRAIGADYRVDHEELIAKIDGSFQEIRVRRDFGQEVKVDYPEDLPKNVERLLLSRDFFTRYLRESQWPEDELMLTGTSGFPGFFMFSTLLSNARVYQISPEKARESGVPQRQAELGRHGDNLPGAIDHLRRNSPRVFQALVEHLTEAVSTMETIETDYVETKELGLFFKERGFGRRWYSQDVSDGTIKTVAMYLALLDPRFDVVAIEEPENSLHPWILRNFVDACRQISNPKQVWLTTHSPVGVDQIPVDCLWIVRRIGGETLIERLDVLMPSVREVVERELFGLGQYWDSGALGGVPEPDFGGKDW